MRRSVHFRAHLILLLLPLVAVPQPAGLAHQGDRFVREFSGAVPAGRRLRINAHGPVNVQAGAANNISYTVHLSVRARTEAEARIVMRRYNVRVTPRGEWVEITAPGGPVISTDLAYAVHLSVRARTEAEARIVMRRYNVRVTPRGEWVEITAPGGPVIS